MQSEQMPLFKRTKSKSFYIEVSPDSSITKTVIVTVPDFEDATRDALLQKAWYEMAGRNDATDVMNWADATIEEIKDGM